MSSIPDMHSFEDLYKPPCSTPRTPGREPGAAEELESNTPKHQRFQQRPLAEGNPPSSPYLLDRNLSPLPVKEASIDNSYTSTAAELYSQGSLLTSSHSKALLLETKRLSQVSLGPSSQPTAPVSDADLFPQVSLALPSPPVDPIISRTSDSSAIIATSSDTKLGDYFGPVECPRTQFTDVQCQDIAHILREDGKVPWSLAPRIYIILRLIGQLQIFDAFIDQGINDLWLPLTISSLPRELSLAYHQEFMETQPLVLTKALDLENKKGHSHFTRDNPFPFETKGTLGEGGFGLVDRILSPVSGREFARKRFRRRRGLQRTELESFMNELKILKRLHHIHCVELVSILSNITRLVVVRPSFEG